MKIWNNCRKAGYVILFAAVISMSAYIFYGAVDTLKYADALENVINGRTVPVVSQEPSFCWLYLLLRY